LLCSALLLFSFLFFSFLCFALLLMQHISILSSFHRFIFSYFQNTSPIYTVGCFRTMFHRTAGCLKWRKYLLMGMSVCKCVSV
jgi:Trk-type K+ transport system membrane component